jgi:hypothetical protein
VLDRRGRASARGVRTCGSVWACPLCSGRIWAKRSRELLHLLCAAREHEVAVGFVTLTMRHRRRDPLRHLWDAMAPALADAMGSGSREVRKLRDELGVLGMARRIEATWSDEHGWNLHVHLLVFAENGGKASLDALAAAMFSAWQSRLVREGRVAPNRRHGLQAKVVDLSRAEEEIAGYLTSAGSFAHATALADRVGESGRHGNRTPWQLLLDAQSGDGGAARRWAEWEQVSKGRRAWDCRSPQLRRLMDEHPEPAEDMPPPPDPVARISDSGWKTVCAAHEPARLLVAAEAGYRRGVLAPGGDHQRGLQEATLAITRLLYEWRVWSPKIAGQSTPHTYPPDGLTAPASPGHWRWLRRALSRLVTMPLTRMRTRRPSGATVNP